MTEKELVKECLKKICQQNGFKNPFAMTHRDFELISQELEDKTGTLISVSTVKRLLNGEFSRIPQTATLNAISNYLGYKNWQDYKNSFLQETPAKPVSQSTILTTSKFIPGIKPTPILYNKWSLLVTAIIFLMIIYSFMSSTAPSPVSYKTASFTLKKTTSNELPNTVVFEYDVSGVKADSFFIQQSWDSTRRVRIDKKNHTLTDIYYEPGYHIAKLIANDSIIKTIDVSIPTDRWIYYAKERSFSSRPQYIHVPGFSDGSLHISKTDAEKSMINLEKENYYVMTYFPSKFEDSSNNFTLKTRVKVSPARNLTCPMLMCEVFTQRNFNYFISMPAGCAHEIKAEFGNIKLNGKTSDLSSLAMNTTEWNDIEINVMNKTVHITINGKHVFTCPYNQASGLITGLGFISNGLAEVDHVKLSAPGNKIIYQNDFDH